MANKVNNRSMVFDSTDYSGHLIECNHMTARPPVAQSSQERTASRTLPGLAENTCSFDCFPGVANAQLNALRVDFATRKSATLVIKQTTDAVSATNESHSATCKLASIGFSATVGNPVTISGDFVFRSVVTVATS